jgi:hypothetical protein
MRAFGNLSPLQGATDSSAERAWEEISSTEANHGVIVVVVVVVAGCRGLCWVLLILPRVDSSAPGSIAHSGIGGRMSMYTLVLRDYRTLELVGLLERRGCTGECPLGAPKRLAERAVDVNTTEACHSCRNRRW